MRIAITGPESTGKTTIARELSQRLRLPLSHEYARLFLEKRKGAYKESDLWSMASGQFRLNDHLDRGAGIIADTEMMVFVVWSFVKFGHCSNRIMELLKSQRFDQYLLCYPDLPWEKDALREAPLLKDRIAIFNEYQLQFENARIPYHIIVGQGSERIANAIKVLDKI